MRTTKTLTIIILMPLLLAAQSQGDSCRSRKTSNAAQTSGKRSARADANREAKSSPSENAAQTGTNQRVGSEMNNSSNTGTGNSSNKPERPSPGVSAWVASGVWGGEHVRMNVRADGASIEYDCAHGTIDETLELDAEGRFDAKCTHVREGPGPIRVGKLPPSRPARYTGRVGGDEMSLTLTLTDTSQVVGTYTLTRGSEGFIRKCR